MLVDMIQYAISAASNDTDEREFLNYEEGSGWLWTKHLSKALLKSSLPDAQRYCNSMEVMLGYSHHDFQIHKVEISMKSSLENVR